MNKQTNKIKVAFSPKQREAFITSLTRAEITTLIKRVNKSLSALKVLPNEDINTEQWYEVHTWLTGLDIALASLNKAS